MIYGPQASFDDTNWMGFLSGYSFTDMFKLYCTKGQIVEARILWHRYPLKFQEFFGDLGAFKAVSYSIAECKTENVKCMTDGLEKLEDILKRMQNSIIGMLKAALKIF